MTGFINDDRKVFLVGKEVLNRLISKIDLTKKIKVPNQDCKNCHFYNNNNVHSKIYCNEFCNKKTKSFEVPNLKYNFRYINIIRAKNLKSITIKSVYGVDNFFMHKKTVYFTPLQIKIMLAYFYISNNKGTIYACSKSDLAKFIGCTTKSIDNCNVILQKFGFINYQEIGNNISVFIRNFSKQYLSKEDGGTGYLVFSKEMFNNILAIKKTHELRLMLKLLINHDANSVYGNKNEISFLDLKDFLPYYKHKTYLIIKFVKSMISKLNKIKGISFEIINNTNLRYNFENSIIGKMLRKELEKSYSANFVEFLKDLPQQIPNIEEKAKNLGKLALEYDYSRIIKVVSNFTLDMLFDKVEKIGANCRYYLEQPKRLGLKNLKLVF